MAKKKALPVNKAKSLDDRIARAKLSIQRLELRKQTRAINDQIKLLK